uniref:Uncharacterized protein n=1 Tax=Psilocybe cubensis TaxID=181762 RepID=A0A8H8CPU6_PSICU
MPIDNKPLAPDALLLDIIAQAREATLSPSPLMRILHDPSLIPSGSVENLKKGHKRPSRSPRRREHRAPVVAAIAIAEEERHAKHLKGLLRASSDQLERETRRADDAMVRAEFAERGERDARIRAEVAEAARNALEDERMRLENDARDYQMQMEASQRVARQLEEDLANARREIEELEYSERKAQEALRRYQVILHDMEQQITLRAAEAQKMIDECYEDGREEGYEDGYQDGLESGRKEGWKKGKKEGQRQGREQGRRAERRNALEAFDKFLVEETNDGDEEHRRERTRRWAESIYKAERVQNRGTGRDGGEFECA